MHNPILFFDEKLYLTIDVIPGTGALGDDFCYLYKEISISIFFYFYFPLILDPRINSVFVP